MISGPRLYYATAMEIRPQLNLATRPQILPATATAAQPEVSLESAVPSESFVSSSVASQTSGVSSAQLPTSAPPALPRPVIFVHGFNGTAESFQPMTDWLGAANKDGGIVDPNRLEGLDGEAKMFTLRFSRPYNSIETNSAELKKTVEAICKATGSAEVDLIVHSLGGLDGRDFLREPDEKIKRMVMIGTPNHGSQLANLELIFREKFGWPIKPPVDDQEVRTVLNQLKIDNPYLNELNDGWPQQRGRADMMIIAGAGVPTLSGGLGITAIGDGVVTRRSANLDGIETKTAWFKTHGALLKTASVMENAAEFLVSGKALTSEANLYDSPSAEKAANDLLAGKTAKGSHIGGASFAEVQQASQLPILDPAFQLGLGLGVVASLMGGTAMPLPVVDIGLSSSQGQSAVRADYHVDLNREFDPVQGRGTINGQAYTERANLVEGKLQWQTDGASGSNLLIEVGSDEKSLAITGQLSGVNADLRLAPFTDASGHIAGIETIGVLNGEQYFMKSTVDVEGILSGTAGRDGEMHVVGLVDGQAVEKSYQVGIERAPGGLHLRARGAGVNVGQEQDIAVDVHVQGR